MAGAGPRSSSNQLKPWRGIAARYDKTAVNYRAGIVLASMIIWLTT